MPTSRMVLWCSNRENCHAVLGVLLNGTLNLFPPMLERVGHNSHGTLMLQCRWCLHWTQRAPDFEGLERLWRERVRVPR